MPFMLKDKPHEQAEKNNRLPIVPENHPHRYPNPTLYQNSGQIIGK
jgi:hypothetical protein